MWWLASLALAIQAAAPDPEATRTIVVEGRSPKILEEAVKACVARGCNSYEYANRVLAAANRAFVGGDYDTSRSMLNAAVAYFDRVKAAPKARAAVLEAQSVVAEHEGERVDAAAAYRRAVNALQQAGDEARADQVLARLDLGDLYARIGDTLEAQKAYGAARRLAAEMGSADISATVEMHQAVLEFRSNHFRTASQRLGAVLASSPPLSPVVRTAAMVMAARIARERGDARPTEALLASLKQQPPAAEPMLLYAPPIDEPDQELGDPNQPRQPVVQPQQGDHVTIQWADIGFWIRPSGLVDEVEVLRGSEQRFWLKPVLQGIAHRVYSPSAGGDAKQGYYAVERFTLGAPMLTPKDSFIRRRAGLLTLTELVLAKSDWPAPPSE